MADWHDAMAAAADRLAAVMRRVAAVKTKTGAEAVNINWVDDTTFEVRAGRPGGRWGWTPIVPAMFENDIKHELFGDEKYWYRQGEYPITLLTIIEGMGDALDDFADIAVEVVADEIVPHH